MVTKKTKRKPMNRTKRIAANAKIRKTAVGKERKSVKKSSRTKRIAANTKIRKTAVGKERKSVKKLKNTNVLLNVFIAILLLSILYIFTLTSPFAVNPNEVKPALASASDIDSEHINWILNEMGAYKLRSYFLVGKSAVIESVITDQDSAFTTIAGNNDPITVSGTTLSPDIRFSMSSTDFMELYAASDTLSKAQDMRKAGTIRVDILKNWFTLTVKGYRSIYDALPA